MGDRGQSPFLDSLKIRKMSCRAIGNCYNGVILRALGRRMRKPRRRHPRSSPSRLILIVAGAFMLIAAFAPRANAQLIAYFNFEGPPTPPFPVNLGSQVPPGAVNTTIVTNYNPNNMSAEPGLPLNIAPGDPDPNLVAMGLRRTMNNDPANFDIPLFSAQGFYQNKSGSTLPRWSSISPVGALGVLVASNSPSFRRVAKLSAVNSSSASR
jgi:hypothetical protein